MNAKRRGLAKAVAVVAAWMLMGLAPGAPVRAADSGGCVTGHIPVPFVLPDGSVHPAGEFTACSDRTLSPVKNLQRISVSGAVQGLFIATEVPAEAEAERPYLTFHRAGNGDLILGGITLPASSRWDRSRTFRLSDRARIAELAAARRVGGGLAFGETSGDTEVILAARAR